MPEISAKTISMVIDGKTVDVKQPSKKNFDLNKALLDPAEFKKFVENPQAFAKKYDLTIDKEISSALSSKLKGIPSLDALRTVGVGPVGATAWAVAVGVYSLASSKIAVAF